MNWFTKLFAHNRRLPEHITEHTQNPCKTEELTDFIQRFVTEETLEPAVNAFANKQHGCGCGCDDSDNIEITVLDPAQNIIRLKQSIPELQVLLAGHKAYCSELEQIMRAGKTAEFDVEAVGEGLMCCIGQWLQCEGNGLRDFAEYNELIEAYEYFQVCTKNMLKNHRYGNFVEAVHALKYEFVQTSGRVQQALLNLVAAILDRQPILQTV